MVAHGPFERTHADRSARGRFACVGGCLVALLLTVGVGEPVQAAGPGNRAEAIAIIADMRQQATEESSRLLANAKAQIEAERAAAVGSLRTEIGGLATTLAGRIVGESLDDDERARRTVDRFIADLEAQPVEQA